MRMFEERVLAGRYAQAFLNIQHEPYSEAVCVALQETIDYYRRTPAVLIFLQMPLFTLETKHKALAEVRARYHLPDNLAALDQLLLAEHRIFLLPAVYAALIRYSNARAQRVPCTATSALALTPEQQQLCTKFVAQHTKLQPLMTWMVDPSLIAGIRLQTTDWLWEDSLDAHLRTLASTVLT